LPSLRKDADGSYRARQLSLDLPAVVMLRGAILLSALTAFAPDVAACRVLPASTGPNGRCRCGLRAGRQPRLAAGELLAEHRFPQDRLQADA